MSYNSNYHSVFDINYHMIFCIKYRREVINDEISNRLKEIFEKICPKYNIVLKVQSDRIEKLTLFEKVTKKLLFNHKEKHLTIRLSDYIVTVFLFFKWKLSILNILLC